MSRIYRNRNIGEWLPSNGGVGGEQKWGMVANGPKVCLRGSENVLKLEGGLGLPWAFLVAQTVKNLPEMQETRVQPLAWEDSPGGWHGNPLQYSCLGNPMDRGAWWATVCGVTKT